MGVFDIGTHRAVLVERVALHVGGDVSGAQQVHVPRGGVGGAVHDQVQNGAVIVLVDAVIEDVKERPAVRMMQESFSSVLGGTA